MTAQLSSACKYYHFICLMRSLFPSSTKYEFLVFSALCSIMWFCCSLLLLLLCCERDGGIFIDMTVMMTMHHIMDRGWWSCWFKAERKRSGDRSLFPFLCFSVIPILFHVSIFYPPLFSWRFQVIDFQLHEWDKGGWDLKGDYDWDIYF